ncbi:MAG: hypothetical protein QUV02_02085 [Maricaulis sp.]|uniref:hypothetical protein n=1 Tax=Maricaulis sp. TaxID=1486257 RepID=UPI00263687D6|nr:hypothetical protein [Maricaulis sp.]MDM7983211.1 hypothetical protein [Maricaulis sp.]
MSMVPSLEKRIPFCLSEIDELDAIISELSGDRPHIVFPLYSEKRRFIFELALFYWRKGDWAESLLQFERCLETYEIQQALAKSGGKVRVMFESMYGDQVAFVYYAALFARRTVPRLEPTIDFIKREAATLSGLDCLMSESLLFEDEVDWSGVLHEVQRTLTGHIAEHYAFYLEILEKKAITAQDMERHQVLFSARKSDKQFEDECLMGGWLYNDLVPDYRFAALLLRYAPDADGLHTWKWHPGKTEEVAGMNVYRESHPN